ncbi:MAG: hypothetical protein QUU85_06540, partial [Candidatus Eisenbacteria bacterium]|nr:hypothetical protein [Candidatus Eisenbacteria bacterium]
MASPEAFEKIEEIAVSDGRFLPAAYLFLLRCIEHARQRLDREGHVTGQELVESARQLAMAEYGPMAKAVLNHWGCLLYTSP